MKTFQQRADNPEAVLNRAYNYVFWESDWSYGIRAYSCLLIMKAMEMQRSVISETQELGEIEIEPEG